MKKIYFTKLYSILILFYETLFLLIQTHTYEVDSGFSRYLQPFPTVTFYFVWILPEIIVFFLIIGLWNFEEFKWAKITTYISLIIVLIVGYTLYMTFIIYFAWILIIYFVIRFSIEFYKLKKHKNEPNRKSNPSPYKTIITLFLIIPLIIPTGYTLRVENNVRYERELNHIGDSFEERKNIYLGDYSKTSQRGSQILRAYLGLPIIRSRIEPKFKDIVVSDDGADFGMNYILRVLYLEHQNISNQVLSNELKDDIETTLLSGKYWFTENGSTSALFWTENHQIAYHTAELLAGQYFEDQEFTKSGMTGYDHINHAEPLILRWIDWKAMYGFSEWQANTYLEIDMVALLNLVDFSENETIATKAAMLLDLICFEFTQNWFKDTYATTHGRTYGETKAPMYPGTISKREDIAEAVWLLLGLGGHDENHFLTQVADSVITSNYTPPKVLEEIGKDAKEYNTHMGRMGFDIDDGEELGIGYTEKDLMFWWGAAAPVSEWTIDISFEVINKYNLDPADICGDGVPEILNFGAKLRGVSLSQYSHLVKEITQGVALETANIYTHRTPYYQLSGAQDHQKGLTGIQEHIWQASLSNEAHVFTSSPSGMAFKGGPFMGGWHPRALFWKNVGIIQYDHSSEVIDVDLVVDLIDSTFNLLNGHRPYNHAYFPQWAFDSVLTSGNWVFGEKDDGYAALYSYNPIFWANEYEITSLGDKNCWIVEMGSIDEDGSFENFVEKIKSASIKITPNSIGYEIQYISPKLGIINTNWNDSLSVNGTNANIGPYKRWDNKYSNTKYGSMLTNIEFNNQKLILDFEKATRDIINL